jgi:Cytochrome P450
MAQKENKKISDEILLAQAIVLLTVVHASTSTTIAIATYFIAKYKHIQDKLQEEIDQICSLDDFPSYEQIHKQLPYMNQVINEVLRLYPSGM